MTEPDCISENELKNSLIKDVNRNKQESNDIESQEMINNEALKSINGNVDKIDVQPVPVIGVT